MKINIKDAWGYLEYTTDYKKKRVGFLPDTIKSITINGVPVRFRVGDGSIEVYDMGYRTTATSLHVYVKTKTQYGTSLEIPLHEIMEKTKRVDVTFKKSAINWFEACVKEIK